MSAGVVVCVCVVFMDGVRGSAAWTYYAPVAVQLMVDLEERYVLDRGDGVMGTAAMHADVARLARCIYACHSPLSPEDVWRYVLEGDLSQAATGRPFGDEAAEARGGAEDEEADVDAIVRVLRGVRIHHLPCTLVQRFAHAREAPTLGHVRGSWRFESKEQAYLAAAVEQRHRRARSGDVLAWIARVARAAGSLPRRIGCVALPSVLRCVDGADVAVPVTALVHEACPTTAVGTWEALRTAVVESEGGGVGRVTRLCVLIDGRRAAGVLVAPHMHWTVHSEGRLRHRLVGGCELRAHAVPAGGVLVELCYPRLLLDAWPWWLSAQVRYIDGALLSSALSPEARVRPRQEEEEGEGEGAHALASGPAQGGKDVLVDPRVKVVVDGWRKSAKARRLQVPALIATATVRELVHCARGMARRICLHDASTKREDASELAAVRRILAADLGEAYVDGVIAHARTNETISIFSVRADGDARLPAAGRSADGGDEGGGVVAAFAVIAFQCILPDGARGTALLVESFAVDRAFQGRGIGGVTFYDLCVPLGLDAGDRCVVFAQCIRTGDAGRFWHDKLDDSSEARALMLQAFSMRPDLVSPQGRSGCVSRARTFSRDRPAKEGGAA